MSKEKFPASRVIAKISKVLGWITIAVGVIYLIISSVGLYSVISDPNQSFQVKFSGGLFYFTFIQLVPSFSILLGGIGSIAFGEVMEMLIAIEKNTRETAENTLDMFAVVKGRMRS